MNIITERVNPNHDVRLDGLHRRRGRGQPHRARPHGNRGIARSGIAACATVARIVTLRRGHGNSYKPTHEGIVYGTTWTCGACNLRLLAREGRWKHRVLGWVCPACKKEKA
jgi:rubrerythrin